MTCLGVADRNLWEGWGEEESLIQPPPVAIPALQGSVPVSLFELCPGWHVNRGNKVNAKQQGSCIF